MQNIERNFQDLKKCTVAIRNSIGDNVLGTGVIVTNDGLMVTCYHVIEDKKSNTIYNSVHISFPSTPEVKGIADVLSEYCNPKVDIAFLQLQKKLPDGVTVADLGEMVSPTHSFIGFGFRKAYEFNGLHSDGMIMGIINKKLKDGGTTPLLIQLESKKIASGMSGSPILDKKINRIIGIVSERYRTQGDVDNDLSLGIPIESLIKVYPDLSKKNPALISLNKFLEHLGLANFVIYKEFDDIYVRPAEYPDIRKCLDQEKCVFIVGTPQCGKTFTAINLLWENWRYLTPKCKYPQTPEEQNYILDHVYKGDNNFSNCTIYIEDPTGKTDHARNSIFENLIVGAIKQLSTMNSYLIVTLRDDIYQKTKPTIIGRDRLDQYVRRLEITEPEASYEFNKEILLRCANKNKCKWYKNPELIKLVLNAIKIGKLPTPLSIYYFVTSTGHSGPNYEVDDPHKLNDLIKEFSKEITELFANRIKKMEQYQILYLCFPFISDSYSLNYIERKYRKAIDSIDIDRRYKKEDLLNSAEESFRSIINSSYYTVFVHPSFSEALPLILTELDENNLPPVLIQQTFSKLLQTLSTDLMNSDLIITFILRNYDKLDPEEINDILDKLVDCTDSLPSFTDSMSFNLNNVPKPIIEKLLERALQHGGNDALILKNLIKVIVNNYDKIPSTFSEEILKKLDRDKEFTKTVIFAVHQELDKVPRIYMEKLLTGLFKFIKKDYYSIDLLKILIKNFDKLPESIMEKILKIYQFEPDRKGTDELERIQFDQRLSKAFIKNFDKVPELYRKKILQRLIIHMEKDVYVSDTISKVLIKHFDKLPSSAVEKLLAIMFQHMDYSGESVVHRSIAINLAKVIVEHYNRLPPLSSSDIDKMLDNLYVNHSFDKYAQDLLKSMITYYKYLPNPIQKRLPEIVYNNGIAAGYFLNIIDFDFNFVPDSFRSSLFESLFKNVEKYEGRYTSPDIPKFVIKNFDVLPKIYKKKALDITSSNHYFAYEIIEDLGNNSEKMPEPYKAKLFKQLFIHMKKDPNFEDKILEKLIQNFDIIPELYVGIVFKSLFKHLGRDSVTTSSFLDALLSNINKIPESHRTELFERLFIYMEKNKYVASYVAYFIYQNLESVPEFYREKLFLTLEKNENVALYTSKTISYHYHEIPKLYMGRILESLYNYWGKTEAIVANLCNALRENLAEVPESFKDRLIEMVENDEETAKNISYNTYSIYSKPSPFSEKMLEGLSKYVNKNDVIAKNVSVIICDNFDKVSKSLINKLLDLANENEKVAYVISSRIQLYYYQSLSNTDAYIERPLLDKILETLFKYVNNSRTIAERVSLCILYDFDKVPKSFRDKLLEMLTKIHVAKIISHELRSKYVGERRGPVGEEPTIPEELLESLSKHIKADNEIGLDLAKIVVNNFDKLSEKLLRILLSKLLTFIDKELSETVGLFLIDNQTLLAGDIVDTLIKKDSIKKVLARNRMILVEPLTKKLIYFSKIK